MAHMTYVTGVIHFMSCVTCHVTCDKVNLGHSENCGKCHIFETRMSQGLQWDINETSFKDIKYFTMLNIGLISSIFDNFEISQNPDDLQHLF